MESINFDQFYQKFLNLYWLRPENAFISAALATKLIDLPATGPTLDLSCGDGSFIFTLFGGELTAQSDIFSETNDLQAVIKGGIDIYDRFDNDVCMGIVNAPGLVVDYGIDINRNMLLKAARLQCYRELLEGDASTSIPLTDGAVNTVYINHTINMYTDIHSLLNELARVMNVGARAYVSVYDASIPDFFVRLLKEYPEPISRRLERGLLKGVFRHNYSLAEWTNLFKEAGLHVESVRGLVPRSFTNFWCIGLRPIAPLFIQLVNRMKSLDAEMSREFKASWIELFTDIGTPLFQCSVDPDDAFTYLIAVRKDQKC